ncbi:exonuclease [Desulfuromonas versatilis]|uniref:Exonuclease n=1 Tax=Desulfuromonas versatilis TaxID=2802975 RepID=A0ABN6DTN5_9BACT|nr:recombination-associated protein RdgC [Desulfuromonas versatilis]BCR03482.1 exonuclease [Desulfuromonas versatilis]
MGILSNTVSICQFRVVGEPPAEELGPWAGECLAKNAFQPIDHGAEELSFGWVEVDDPKHWEFASPRVYWRDHYLVFSLRRDQRRVPAALLKAHLEEAEAEFLAAHPGLQRVPKQKREELKEAVRGSLLARTLPTPAIFDAVWDTRNGQLTLASLSAKAVELFENLFKQTFEGLRLVTVHPFARAEQVLDQSLQPALLEANQASTDAVLDLIQDNQWLGWDFMLWLMHQTMTGASRYSVCRPGPAVAGDGFVAYLNDRLILQGGGENGMQKVTVAGPQDNFSEVRTALRGGKQIHEAILYLELQEHLWKLTLKGSTFHFASFKAPPVKLEKDTNVDQGSEKEALFYERMYVLEEGLQLFDSLYALFLQNRLDASWPDTAQQIREWLEKD